MIKMIHVSDIHLGATFKSSSYGNKFSLKRQREIKETFFNLIKKAKEDNVNYLIISGDLFDSSNIKISELKNVFKSLKDFNNEVLIISGNHDPLIKDSFWNAVEIPENVTVFDNVVSTKEYPEDNLCFYGYSWSDFYIKDKIFEKLPELDKAKINVLIGHGDIYNKKSDYLPIDKDKLEKKGFDYVALGHIHKPDFITDRIAYAGSLEPFDFSETGEHGYIYVELSKEKIKTDFIPYAKREFVVKEITLKGDMLENEFNQMINDIDVDKRKLQNLYRIIIKGRHNYQLNIDEENLNEIYKDDFAYIEFKNKAKPDFNLETIKSENKDNIISRFIEELEERGLDDENNKAILYTGLEYLLKSKEGSL